MTALGFVLAFAWLLSLEIRHRRHARAWPTIGDAVADVWLLKAERDAERRRYGESIQRWAEARKVPGVSS